ncbi:hypothetical protein [Microbispora bryophytorum]|uniref:hypothetical protein n=1 Tax=Microbispora bryophytorum TaxID=1460882 RepID=UPI0033F6710B
MVDLPKDRPELDGSRTGSEITEADGPQPQHVTRHVFVEDSATAEESMVIDGRGSDGSVTIRVFRSGVDGRTASADADGKGLLLDRIGGRASHKEHRELRAAQGLLSRLNQLGENWRDPEVLSASARDERGVDCIAHNDAGQRLLIQVTTVERAAWAVLARQASLERTRTQAEAVEEVRDAIGAKRTRADRNVILVLDATDSVGGALQPVVNAFREQYGEWAAGIGFRQIWVAGPTADLVHRLDSQ